MPEVIVNENDFFSEVECASLKDILHTVATADERTDDAIILKFLEMRMERTPLIKLKETMPHAWNTILKDKLKEHREKQVQLQKMARKILAKLPNLVKQFHGIDI